MNESEIPIAANESGSPSRRRAPAKRRTGTRPKSARRAPTAGRRAPSRRSASAERGAAELQGLLRGLAKRASAARGHLATASGEGAKATRRAWKMVSGASRKTIDRLAAEWKRMDATKKAQFVAALLTALAAASAPIVRRGLKNR